MNVFLRKSGATVAAALLASSCAVRHPAGTTPDPAAPAAPQAGGVVVPVTLPALAEQSVQHVYHRNYINTVEVRLRDSLGNEAVQYVARNAYLATSRASGTVNVPFHNVMPGTFTLTVRTSHERLLSETGRISYDGLRDIFFVDGDGDELFDPGENEPRLISKSGSTNTNSNFLVFAPQHIDPNWIFPDALRTDTSTVSAGFGIGAATESIVAGQTTQVAVTVGQVPRWTSAVPMTSREVTAGEAITLTVADGDVLHAVDMVTVVAPSVSFTRGIVDLGAPLLNSYAPTVDATAGTVVFTPTRSTNGGVGSAPGAWPIWLTRLDCNVMLASARCRFLSENGARCNDWR